MSATIYLADLRHNYTGVLANDCMPLGVAYLKAVMDRDVPEAQSRIFAYPDRLWEALRHQPPDVLMLSNYCWNEALSLHFASLAKRVRPETVVVVGGPNISIEPARQTAFVASHPDVDIYVLGEGDFLASEVVQTYIGCGKSLAALRKLDLPSAIQRRDHGTVTRQEMRQRHRGVGEIPSPWLSGIQDEFFDGKLAPMVETNRGCPFTCTFCVQGTTWYTKVHNFSEDRVKAELEYIARRIKVASPRMGTLRIADSNYGMFERDVEISRFIGSLQRQYGWPTFIDATTGKNRPDRIIQSVEQVSGALVLYQAVQSLDEDVLRNVKRQTIKLEAYEQLQIHMRGRGLRSNSDLILGLPGETLRTHMDAILSLVDAEIDQVHNFQLMMLKGSELETDDSRRRSAFGTRFRVLPKNFGVYGGDQVFDVEEIVVTTETLGFDDYLTARKVHLTCSVFQNDGWFEDLVRFVKSVGIKRSEWWSAMHHGLESSTGPVGQFVEDFVRETRNELFPTRDACTAFYADAINFDRLLKGEIGDNLMYKYRAIASFFLWKDICELAMAQTRNLLARRGVTALIKDFDEFWEDLHLYVALKHAHGATADEVLAPSAASFRYDLDRWLIDGTPARLDCYRFDSPTIVEFRLTPDAERELATALNVWSTNLKGLSKLVTRIQTAWQVRQPYLKPHARAAFLQETA